ncbi:MAG: patatin-like phospholipase family protein [Desulfobacterales bacterium]|nr:MAG: patatin-like phospholipase family protein [Desulfobacterales bacterium]
MGGDKDNLALVLSGGGARAAYQVGFLRCLAKNFPDLNIPIMTGVSAGAINAAFLANHQGSFSEAVEMLSSLWLSLTVDQVFCVDSWKLVGNIIKWGIRLVSGGIPKESSARSLLDSTPLQHLLQRTLAPEEKVLAGIQKNLRAGKLKAIAITGTNYGTGQTVTWVQGEDIRTWERPWRRSELTEITIDHIISSAALPLIFPAVRVGDAWYGDGGIRQSTPLSPAIYLGANRILGISTRYGRSLEEANKPVCMGYPPPAQIAGVLMNSLFLDALDQDIRTLERTNQLLDQISERQHWDRYLIDHFMIRPSQDLGKLAGGFEPDLPYMFRYLTRGLGTQETKSPDWLSMVMFDPKYLNHLIQLGETDAERHAEEIGKFLSA